MYDSSRVNYVPGVKVINNAGQFALTDSMGKYTIAVAEKDSLAFIFNNKSTVKFPILAATDPSHFDVSLRVPYKGKYKVLKEIIVHTRTYREDSIENRQEYGKVFNYQKPGLQTSIGPSGVAGADVAIGQRRLGADDARGGGSRGNHRDQAHREARRNSRIGHAANGTRPQVRVADHPVSHRCPTDLELWLDQQDHRRAFQGHRCKRSDDTRSAPSSLRPARR